MERTLTLRTDQGEVFAVLQKAKGEETLLSVRQRVKECEDFSFLLFGIELKRKQESKTLVRDCSQRNNDDGGLVLSVKTTARPQEVFASPPPCSEERSAPASRSANQVQDFKIKCFSEAEIQSVRELFAKERMTFHNGLLEKIKGDENMSDWDSRELLGVIEASWVMRKTELLKLKVKEILSKDISATTDCKGRDQVLMRNLESVEKATFTVNSEYAKLSEKVRESEANRSALEESFDKVFSALKKSQANLQKSIEAFLWQNEVNCSSHDGESPTPAVDSMLREDEISVLAQDVKTDYESD